MSISSSRAVRRAVVVCLAAALSLATVFASHAAAGTSPAAPERAERAHAYRGESVTIDVATRGRHVSTPLDLGVEGRTVRAFAPISSDREPLTVVYLHGVHGRPENGCPWLRSGASEVGWLVCPEGAVHETTGTASWGGDVLEQAAVVARARRAAERRGASSEPGVAVGFSQGGYVALDLVKTRLGRFRGLVLIAAPEAHPSAQRLKDAGVARVALAAGSLDAAYAPLVADTARLASEGIEARFFDLGRVGHTYAAEDPDVLREAITWAAGHG